MGVCVVLVGYPRAAFAGCADHPGWAFICHFFNWGGLLWPVLYLLVALRGAGIGGGDIKLALPLGMLVGATAGPLAVLMACGGAAVVTLLASGIARVKGGVPHGPSMVVSAGLVMVVYPLIEGEANILRCLVAPCG